MIDLLARWWVHELLVWRLTSSGSRVDVFDPPIGTDPTPVKGFVSDGSKLVADSNGKQVTSSAQVALPSSEAYIPVGSLVKLPARFGGRTSKVVVSAVGDGGGQPTPDHIEISLL